jgi:GcrA cell cycle regulator
LSTSSSPGPFFWCEERIARLKELNDQGLSGRAIAALLGNTKNSVIGKLHRLGLSKPVVDRPAPRPKSGARMARPQKRKPPKPLFFHRPQIVEPEPTPEEIAATACTLFDLGHKSCRWPLGPEMAPATHNTLFCGAVSVDGYPYCTRHCRRSYVDTTWPGAQIKYSAQLPPGAGNDVPASERAAAVTGEPTGTTQEVAA